MIGQTIFFISVLLLFSVQDIKTQIIPDKWIAAAFVGSLVIRIFYSPEPIMHYIYSALIIGTILIILALLSNGIGGGDIKLLTWIAFTAGLYYTIFVLLIACLVTLLYMLLKKRKEAIPFAPFLLIGALTISINNTFF